MVNQSKEQSKSGTALGMTAVVLPLFSGIVASAMEGEPTIAGFKMGLGTCFALYSAASFGESDRTKLGFLKSYVSPSYKKLFAAAAVGTALGVNQFSVQTGVLETQAKETVEEANRIEKAAYIDALPPVTDETPISNLDWRRIMCAESSKDKIEININSTAYVLYCPRI